MENVINLVEKCLQKSMFTFLILPQIGNKELVLSTKMTQIKAFKELLLNSISFDIDQCSTKIRKNLNQENMFEST